MLVPAQRAKAQSRPVSANERDLCASQMATHLLLHLRAYEQATEVDTSMPSQEAASVRQQVRGASTTH